MGIVTSSVSPNASANETLNNIYKQNEYKWSPGQIAANIRQKKVTPIYHNEQDRTRDSKCFCSICYFYYPKINETTCCGQGICTECLAAICSQTPSERECPFCRQKNFSIKPNVEYNYLKSPSTGNFDEPVLVIPDDDLPDDILCILIQYPTLDKTTVVQLYKDGMNAEEIIEVLELNPQI